MFYVILFIYIIILIIKEKKCYYTISDFFLLFFNFYIRLLYHYHYIMSNIVYSSEILYLRFPKLISNYSNTKFYDKNSTNKLNQFIHAKNKNEDNSKKYTINLSNKLDKNERKYKNRLNLEETLESKKNKLDKKVRKNSILNTENFFIDDSIDLDIKNSDTYKINKYRKKEKNKNINNSSLIFNHNTITKRAVNLSSALSIQDLSSKLNIPEAEIIKYLFLQGISVTVNDIIDIVIAKKIALHYSFEIIENNIENIHLKIQNNNLNFNNQPTRRPPVITIFGHVDHGKTTLLDSIMKTNLVNQEYGGITQAINGYEIELRYNSELYKLVFLDTPGHEAFMSMRLRGAKITDIALLVVAADDGLKPQTIESIKYILSMELAYIVVINKIDKSDIDLFKIKEELSTYNIVSEEWGGNAQIVEVSALNGQNIDILLSKICLLVELQNLKADFTQFAEGTILEAYLDKKKGIVARALVQQGTLKMGDLIVAGTIYGKVKNLLDISNKQLTNAYPSSIVQILAFSLPPESGSKFIVVNNEKEAKQLINANSNTSLEIKEKLKKLNKKIAISTNNKIKQLNLILKTDTQGALEALMSSLIQIPQKKVQINLINANVGNFSYTDIELALTSGSILIGFQVDTSNDINNLVKQHNLNLKKFNVIYDLLNYIQDYMLSLVDLEYEYIFIGSALVQNIFSVNKGYVAGCIVNEGILKKMSYIYVYQEDNLVYSGFLTSLKRVKNDVNEVTLKNECGVMCNYNDWKIRDVIKAYDLKPKEKSL